MAASKVGDLSPRPADSFLQTRGGFLPALTGRCRGNCSALPGVWLQVPDPIPIDGAAQTLLPVPFSSQPLKSRATTAIGLGQPQGWPVPWSGLGRAVEWESAELGQAMPVGGQQRQGHLFWSRCPQRSHIIAGMEMMQPDGLSASQLSPTCVLSHPAMALHRHSSGHGMLSPAWTTLPPSHLMQGWHLQGQV